MYKCLCTKVYRNLRRKCPECGLDSFSLHQYRHQMNRIQIALSIMRSQDADLKNLEIVAYGYLSTKKSLSEVAKMIEMSEEPGSKKMASILNNMESSSPSKIWER